MTQSVKKEFSCNVGDLGWISGLGRSSGGGHGNPLQYSCLENPLGQRNLVGCSPRGCTTERLNTAQHILKLREILKIFKRDLKNSHPK